MALAGVPVRSIGRWGVNGLMRWSEREMAVGRPCSPVDLTREFQASDFTTEIERTVPNV